MRVVWSAKAERSYAEIINFLEYKWGQKYVDRFIALTESTFHTISEFPNRYAEIENNPNVRKALVHKTVSLFYEVDETEKLITLLVFWANRKNPENLATLLES